MISNEKLVLSFFLEVNISVGEYDQNTPLCVFQIYFDLATDLSQKNKFIVELS